MAVTYPVALPTSPNYQSVTLRAVNQNTTSSSPFTYRQQIVSHGGQRWEASLTLPPMKRDQAAAWKSALTSLKGSLGTFYLGDPNYPIPRGSLRSSAASVGITVDGFAGNSFMDLTMQDTSDTLKAGDYLQVGTGINSKLHMILQDITGNGSVEVWPDLRFDYEYAQAYTTSPNVSNAPPQGVFRLATNFSSWDINNLEAYGITFEAIEAIAG